MNISFASIISNIINFSFKLIMRKIILLLFMGLFCVNMFAQKTITGTVRDVTDNLPGVSVQIVGTTRGTVTDLDGNYSITVQEGDRQLSFSFIGMKSQTISIGNRTQINVTMASDDNVLGEVVVSALGIKRENKSLTVAQQRVDAETMAEVRDQNIVSSLSGKIAGVQVTPPGSATGSARIVIRGNSSFTGNNQPLWVVDGMIIDNYDGSSGANAQSNSLDMGNGAADINADDIETIDVLKGPNAAALYGSRAANGAIIITTKKAKEGRFKLSLASNSQFYYISQFPDYENAFGIGHMQRFVNNNEKDLITVDANGNLYPYPGIPNMAEIARGGGNSNGGPHLGQPYLGLDGTIRYYEPKPNNVTDFYQTGHIYTNNVAIEGGNQDNNYRISYTNTRATDVVEKQNLVNKNNVTLRYFNTLVKNITLDSKITYVSDRTKNRRYTNGGSYNPTGMFIKMPRTLSLEELKHYKDDNGNELGNLGDVHNPYWSINETSNQDNKNRIMGSFDLSYQILPSLKLSLRYGKDYNVTQRNEFRNKGASGDPNGWYGEWVNTTNNDTYDFLATFNERFNDFSILATAGAARYDYGWYNTSANIPTLKQAGLAHITNSDDYPSVGEDTGRKRLNAMYGYVSVGFRDWVYLDGTARNDWSSTLPSGNNSYFYPSVGVSFIPSELLDIPSRVFFGKIRASWAQVGNDTDPYRLKTYYDLNSDNIFNAYKYASFQGTLPNADLKPEITTSYETGLDLRFFNGRLVADFTYYNQESKNQIIEAQMAASSGYARRMYNAGVIRNEGVELALSAIPIETKTFSWEVMLNFSKNNSKVLSMVDGLDEIVIGGNRGKYATSNVVKVGYPYGVLKYYSWMRDNEGRRMVDSNGEPVPLADQYMGNVNPDWLLGISNRFRYKSFDLYALIDIKKGGKILSGSRGQGTRASVFSGDEKAREDFWYRRYIMGDGGGANSQWGGSYMDDIYFYIPERYDNDMNTYMVEEVNGVLQKMVDEHGNWIPDPNYEPEKCERYFLPGDVGYYGDSYPELFTYDASYVKFRELSVGYNLPKKFISKLKMTNARISAVGRNIWIIDQNTPKGLDPESSINAGNAQGLEYGALPPTTTFGFDIKISF